MRNLLYRILASLIVGAILPTFGAQITVVSATASNTYPGLNPELAFDGNTSTWWGSGSLPTPTSQWIQLDLGTERRLSSVRLLPSQDPAGTTTHGVHGRDAAGNWNAYFGTLSGSTFDSQWLELPISNTALVRYVFVETTQSPSWVSWREIEVFGYEAPPPPSPSGTLSATPPSCTVPSGGTYCSTTLSWTVSNSASGFARVWLTSVPPTSTETAGGWVDEWPSSSSVVVPWITPGTYQFTLREGTSALGPILASVSVTGDGTSPPPPPPVGPTPVFTEAFGSFGGVTGTCNPDFIPPGYATGGNLPDPDGATNDVTCPVLETWNTMGVLDGNHSVYRCMGVTAPECWSVQNGHLVMLGRRVDQPFQSDGFPMIGPKLVDSVKLSNGANANKFISAEADFNIASCTLNGAPNSSCFLSLVLLHNETDYRAINLSRWPQLPAGLLIPFSNGPTSGAELFSPTSQTIGMGQWNRLRIDYVPGLGLKYYINGELMRFESNSPDALTYEPMTHMNAILRGNPHVSVYIDGVADQNNVRACVDNIRVFVTDTERPNEPGSALPAEACLALPVVTVTSPTQYQAFPSPASIPLSATATPIIGSITKVEYFEGPTKIAEATQPPYSATWSNVPLGTYSISARAIDSVGDVSAMSNPVLVSVGSGTSSVTVITAGAGEGTVTSTPGGITCGASCSSNFAPGTSVTLTATAASGSRFQSWSGACTGTRSTCQLTVNSQLFATATFAPVR